MTSAFRVICDGLQFPEGPIALPDGSVVVCEIRTRCLTLVGPDGSKRRIAELGGGPNGAAIGPDGRCYVCNNGGLVFAEDPVHGLRGAGFPADYSGGRIEAVDLKTGRVEILYDRGPNGPLSGPNDIVFDRSGGFWFTDMGKTRPRSIDRGGVYYARPDGSRIEEVIYPVLSPNGIGLSADERVLYVAETQGGRLWAFDIEAPGKVKLHPYPSPNGGRLVGGVGGLQLFDSLALDAAGEICVATLNDNCGITVFSPLGGVVEQIPLPDRMTTNICFGGPDLRTAYVTMAATGRLIAMPWKRPGLPLNFLNR
jgi:gluconolactonase